MSISVSDKSEIATLGKLRSAADRYGDIFLFFFIYLFNIHKKTIAYYPISRFLLLNWLNKKYKNGKFPEKANEKICFKK